MAEEIVKVELQNLTRVDKDIYYMRTSAGNMRVYGGRIVANTVSQSKKIFANAIQKYVYSISSTTYTRTGDLGRSVRSRNFNKGLGAGEIYIDESLRGPNGYFYPDSVEWGISSKPAYYGRHFWAKGKSEALVQFKKDFQPYALEIASKLLGK
jgi:hypothetical protein